MAKENKVVQGVLFEDTVVESPVVVAPVEEAKRKEETRQEIELRYGQCIVAPVGKEDEEILTTIDDWNTLYNAGANQGRFVLKAEKKS